MIDTDDNIEFDPMPDFGPILGKPEKPQPIERAYNSLYDELLDKCHPSKFDIESVGLDKFYTANEIYSQLLDCKAISRTMGKQEISEEALRVLRNRAMYELGVRISTKKKFDELKLFLDPRTYYNRQPYNGDLVAKAGALYYQLLNNKDDIRALEQLEQESVSFQQDVDEYDYTSLGEDEYLEKHPQGKYTQKIRQEMQQKKSLKDVAVEKEWYLTKSAKEYLSYYPQGVYALEAHFYLEHTARKYLKQYPSGRYTNEASESIQNTMVLLVLGGLSIIVVVLFILFGG